MKEQEARYLNRLADTLGLVDPPAARFQTVHASLPPARDRKAWQRIWNRAYTQRVPMQVIANLERQRVPLRSIVVNQKWWGTDTLAAIRDTLMSKLRGIVARFAEMTPILFAEGDVLCFKGIVLRELYPPDSPRITNDVDVWAQDIEVVLALERRLDNYRTDRIEFTSRHELAIGQFELRSQNSDDQVVLDIHIGGYPTYPQNHPLVVYLDLFRRSISLAIDKRIIQAPSWEDTILLGVAHILQNRRLTLRDINDFYLLLETKGDRIDWRYVLECADENAFVSVLCLLSDEVERRYEVKLQIPEESRCRLNASRNLLTRRLLEFPPRHIRGSGIFMNSYLFVCQRKKLGPLLAAGAVLRNLSLLSANRLAPRLKESVHTLWSLWLGSQDRCLTLRPVTVTQLPRCQKLINEQKLNNTDYGNGAGVYRDAWCRSVVFVMSSGVHVSPVIARRLNAETGRSRRTFTAGKSEKATDSAGSEDEAANISKDVLNNIAGKARR